MPAPYSPHPQVMLTQLNEAEAVLLHTHSRDYFSLNETGLLIWKELAQGRTPEETVTALCAAYEVDDEAAREHVVRFIGEVEAAGLLVRNAQP